MVRKMPAIGRITDSDTSWTISKTRGENSAGVKLTCSLISPTCLLTLSNIPDRLPITPPTSISLSHSVIFWSTLSTGQPP